MHPDRFANGRAGSPDALQDPVQYRVIWAGVTTQGERQVTGANVEAVDAVDGQCGLQVGDGVGRLGHDEAEGLRNGQHPARGPVAEGRISHRAYYLESLGGRLDVRDDDTLTAQVESPSDISGVRMADAGDGMTDQAPYRGSRVTRRERKEAAVGIAPANHTRRGAISRLTTLRPGEFGGQVKHSGISALVPFELLGLFADDGKDALIAGRFRDSTEQSVECLNDD